MATQEEFDELCEEFDDSQIHQSKVVRALLLAAGTFFLVMGVIGIALPVLPTTPFLLLAAACYARSSKKFYVWLLSNKMFGHHIRNYRKGLGIPKRVKIKAISLLWATMTVSAVYVFIFIGIWWVPIPLYCIAILVSAHIWNIKTLED